MAIALLAAAQSLCHAQPQQATTENQARYLVYGAFMTHAVPEIMGERVTLGLELEQRLGLSSGADRLRIYDALMTYTDGKRLNVRKATPEELASYRPQAKRDLQQPVFRVQAGEIQLLVEYDLQANTIPFVGQLAVAAQPPRAAAPPVIEQRTAPTAPAAASTPAPTVPIAVPASKPAAAAVAVVAPKPVAVKAVAPRAAPAEVLRPNGPCLVMPVMSEQDLANCRAAPGGVTRVDPGPPMVMMKPQARVAPSAPQRTATCEIKPVMSDEDLANCRAAPGGAQRIDPGAPASPRPQLRAEPQQAQRRPATPCVIKPVMSEEDLAACR